VIGILAIALGVWALIKTGVNTDHIFTPSKEVLGLPHTPALALGEIAFGILLLIASVLGRFGAFLVALLGVVALILAFGLTLAVGRYEDRRAATVTEANAIGTTYLRGQLLAEPVRTRSLDLLRRYTDLALQVSREVPGSAGMRRTTAAEGVLQRRLWRLAGEAISAAPNASAPRLYVDSLNTTIDSQEARLSSTANRVPGAVLVLEVFGAAAAMGLLALHISVLGRGLVAMLAASVLVTLLLLVTFDLDRPTRGLITVPSTPLQAVRLSMALPPAAQGPARP
jgi:hypothetical protein